MNIHIVYIKIHVYSENDILELPSSQVIVSMISIKTLSIKEHLKIRYSKNVLFDCITITMQYFIVKGRQELDLTYLLKYRQVLLHKVALGKHWIAYKGSYRGMAIVVGNFIESVNAIQNYIMIDPIQPKCCNLIFDTNLSQPLNDC